jgi:hypothetical protein
MCWTKPNRQRQAGKAGASANVHNLRPFDKRPGRQAVEDMGSNHFIGIQDGGQIDALSPALQLTQQVDQLPDLTAG